MKRYKKGFTLVELLAVIVILAIVLAIAVPAIGNLIESTRRGAFESDAKMVIKALEYKLLQDDKFDVLGIKKDPDTGEDTVASTLKLSTENYAEVSVYKDEANKINVLIIGQNKWENLVVYGTSLNMTVDASGSYEGGYICAGTIGDASPNEVLAGKTFTNNDGAQTGTMPNKTGSVTAQGITRNGTTLKFQPQEGYYTGTTGNTVDYTDANFVSSNIKQGVSIFGVTGTYAGKRSASGTTATLNPGASVVINVGFPCRFIKTELNKSHNNSVIAYYDEYYGSIRYGNTNYGTAYITPYINYTVGATSFTITASSDSYSNSSTVYWYAQEF